MRFALRVKNTHSLDCRALFPVLVVAVVELDWAFD